MLDEQTITKMNELKLFGMAKGFADRNGKSTHTELSHAEFVGLLVDDEKASRENRRMNTLLKTAGFKLQACLENVDYRHPRELSKQIILELVRGEWIARRQNILITGPTGVGKSYLAEALGHQACRAGYACRCYRVPRLFETLFTARADGSHLKMVSRLAKVPVLVLDDFCLSSLNEAERKDLLEIVEDHYGTGSLIATSQFPTKEWHALIGDPTIADAICDRMFHNAYQIELKGESMRKGKDKNQRKES